MTEQMNKWENIFALKFKFQKLSWHCVYDRAQEAVREREGESERHWGSGIARHLRLLQCFFGCIFKIEYLHALSISDYKDLLHFCAHKHPCLLLPYVQLGLWLCMCICVCVCALLSFACVRCVCAICTAQSHFKRFIFVYALCTQISRYIQFN